MEQLSDNDIARMQAMGRGMITIAKEFRFEASHVLPKHEGKCSRLHGHSWVLTVYVDGYVDPECGFVVDYAKLKRCVQGNIIDYVDHAHLGYGPMHNTINGLHRDTMNVYPAVYGAEFYPSSENLIQAFRRLLEPLIPELAKSWQDVRLKALKLNETCTSECMWVRDDR